jgi:hypothetical protein
MQTLEPELADHLADVPLREIGKRSGISHEAARKRVQRQAREHITKVCGDLLIASKTGELPVLLIPNQPGPDLDQATAYFVWLCNELTEVGVVLGLTYKPVENGVAIAFEDLSLAKGAVDE